MKRLLPLVVALACLLGPAVARAFVAQTVTFTGSVSDFDPSNLIRDDRYDTQQNCSPLAWPLDLGRAYITNDANYLYVGVELDSTCFCSMNLGFAFDIDSTVAGGTTDPFGRKIGWTAVPYRPDWIVYAVPPVSCNSFDYQVLYGDSSGTWVNRSTWVNPSWGGGSHGLNMYEGSHFRELKLPLSVLGAVAGRGINLEMWVTQDSPTKGPLDALMSSDVQMSHPNTTTWDTTAVVSLTHMFPYTVLSAIDNVPPTVAAVMAGPYTLQSNGQFALLQSRIDVTFSEPVDQATAETKTNYAYAGPGTARTISSAVRDAAISSLVHLTLNAPIGAANPGLGPYNITVTNVKDLANNVMVANGTSNVGGFWLQNVTFNGNMKLGLCGGAFAPTDTFAIEGGSTPLTWTLRDNALMTDANSDSIYNTTVPFVIPHKVGALSDSLEVQWKFSHNGNFEPLANNREYYANSANGAATSVTAAWNNDDPANYTSRAVDVVFQVDASHINPQPADVITLLGTNLPLHFTQPGVTMKDDGVAPDLVAGDHIYTARVTFPACSPKHEEWKVDYNGVIECSGGGQGNRSFTLDDLTYSTSTPQVLPARGFNRCTVTDKPITVVFKVNMTSVTPTPGNADTVVVKGDGTLLSWGWPPNPAAIMADDGAGYDTRAGDRWFTKAITLPDSTPNTIGFKYSYKLAGWSADSVECLGYGNRSQALDDQVYSVANPIVRLLNVFNYCSDPTAVGPDGSSRREAGFGALRPVMPNPVAHRATFAFELYRSGPVTFNVYDVAGRRVASLVNGVLQAGVHTVAWDGRSEGGLSLANGVYMYELAMDGARLSRRMILVH